MVESWVEPATSASVKTIMIIAGSASEAIITSRLEPMPPKLVPTSRPASARKKRALPSSAMMAMRSADQVNSSPVREGRHQRGRDPGGGEDQVGGDAEQPGGVVGQHHFLAQQPDEVAIGLDQRRPSPAQQPRLHLAHEPGEQRRQQQHQQHLRALHGEIEDHGHMREHQQQEHERGEDEAEVTADGQELQVVEPVGGERRRRRRSARRARPRRDRASRP